MGVMLPDGKPRLDTRSERVLQAVTISGALRVAPLASLVSLPLAYVVARNYEEGYASHFGIPAEFVRADLAAAVAPFALIFTASVILFLTFAEVERLGLAMWLKAYGSFLRICFFGLLLGFGVSRVKDGEIAFWEFLATVLLYYAVLWWTFPLLSLLLRPLRPIKRAIRRWWKTPNRRAIRVTRHIFRASADANVPDLKGRWKLTAVLLTCFTVLVLGTLIGKGYAKARITYGVYYEKDQPRIILAVYGDRMFVGHWLRDPAEKDVLVVVQPVSALEGKTIETWPVGPLNTGLPSTRPPPDAGWDDLHSE